ncbi:hypothetical protein HZ326_24874 [Fusarium oxysporum f. sp. albedinis]|nr:hypothetical protein HZ326_24874 [Fusarium oxysporum f. sp. albedinis]
MSPRKTQMRDDFLLQFTSSTVVQNFHKSFHTCCDAVEPYRPQYLSHQAKFNKFMYKIYKCQGHNKFFGVNIYQKDPINKHHWRVHIARPADSIDLLRCNVMIDVSVEALQ